MCGFTFTHTHSEAHTLTEQCVCKLISATDVKCWPFLVKPPAAAGKSVCHCVSCDRVCESVCTVFLSAVCMSSWRNPAARPRWQRQSWCWAGTVAAASAHGAAPPRTSDWLGKRSADGCAWFHPQACWQGDHWRHFLLWWTLCPPGGSRFNWKPLNYRLEKKSLK